MPVPKRQARRSALAALVLTLLVAPAADAVQTSGSIVLIPFKQTGLVENQDVTVDVYFNNESTQTPDPGNPQGAPPLVPTVPAVAAFPNPANPELMPNPGIITGPITVELCGDGCECNLPVPDDNGDGVKDLIFVPGPAGGCDMKIPGVTSCAADGASKVVIALPPTGLVVPNAGPVYLATLRFKNTVPEMGPKAGALGLVHLQGMIGMCSLESCVVPGVACSKCSAEGCTFVQGERGVSTILQCKHSCLNSIDFKDGLDTYHFSGVINAAGYDPTAESVTITLKKEGAMLLTRTIPAGSLVAGTDKWDFDDGTTRVQVFKQKSKPKVDCSQSYKVVIDTDADLTAAQMKDPTLTVELTIDGRPTFRDTGEWKSRPANQPTGPGIKTVEYDFPVKSEC